MAKTRSLAEKIIVISQSLQRNQEMCVAVGEGYSRTFYRPIDPKRSTRPFNKHGRKKKKKKFRH